VSAENLRYVEPPDLNTCYPETRFFTAGSPDPIHGTRSLVAYGRVPCFDLPRAIGDHRTVALVMSESFVRGKQPLVQRLHPKPTGFGLADPKGRRHFSNREPFCKQGCRPLEDRGDKIARTPPVALSSTDVA
jgi:hypothetical protein